VSEFYIYIVVFDWKQKIFCRLLVTEKLQCQPWNWYTKCAENVFLKISNCLQTLTKRKIALWSPNKTNLYFSVCHQNILKIKRKLVKLGPSRDYENTPEYECDYFISVRHKNCKVT